MILELEGRRHMLNCDGAGAEDKRLRDDVKIKKIENNERAAGEAGDIFIH